VNDDGTLRVTETILIEFHDSFKQGKRSIPLDRIESIDNVEVVVGNDPGNMVPATEKERGYSGAARTFHTDTEDGDYIIEYGFERTSSNGSDSIRAVEISYTAHGAIRDYPDAEPAEQQVRWTAISSEVTETGPVESTSATIILPEPIPGERLAIDPDPTTVEPDRVVWESGGLNSGDSLQVSVAFPPVTDAVAPAWQADADKYEGRQEHLPAISLVLGMLSLVIWVVTILFMVVRGVRDPEVGLVADIIPERPDDLAAPLVGTLIDESVDTKDVLAGLLDLDRQGFVRIREALETGESKPEYQIELIRPIADAPVWDQPMLEGLFQDDADIGEVVDLQKSLKKLREKSFSNVSRAYDQALFARGYFLEDPHTTRMRWIGIAVAMLLVTAAILGAVGIWARRASGWFAVPGVIVGVGFVLALILTTKAAVKTTEGAIVAAKWKAYGRYLDDLRKGPDPDRFFEVLSRDLPWAVALGFDSSWSKMAEELNDTMHNDDRRGHRGRHGRTVTPVFVGGFGNESSSSSSGSGGGGGGLQGASSRTLAAIGGGSGGMFAMLNEAAASFNSGASSGSSSGGGFSGSSSIGSSGGGGHSFS
jgi:hypothetical protein